MQKWTKVFAVLSLFLFFVLLVNYQNEEVIEFDENMQQLFEGNSFIGFFHFFGETKFIIVIALIMLVVLWLKQHHYRGMFFVLCSIACGNVLNQLVKRWVERPRPEIADQLTSYSFPSGHAMVGLLYLFTIGYLLSEQLKNNHQRIILWCAVIIMVLLIGLSRVAESRHFASDVVAGWSLGYSWFILCVLWYENRTSKRGQKRLQ